MRELLLALAAVAAAASVSPADVLYQNGSIVTDPGAGAGGFNASRASLDFDTQGFSVLSPARLGDDFTVNNEWMIESVTVNAYITGSYAVPPVASPFTGVTFSIWRGAPEASGSSLVATSSAMIGNAFSGTYRVGANPILLGNAERPVFDLTASFTNPVLSPGTYWIDYTLTGGGGIIFSPMVMTTDPFGSVTVPGNAQRKLSAAGSWVTLFGGLSEQGLDFPFTVRGFVVPEPAAPAIVLSAAVAMSRRRPRTSE